MFFLLWHSHHPCLSCCQKKKPLSIVSIGRRIWPKEEGAYLLSAASIIGTVGSKGLTSQLCLPVKGWGTSLVWLAPGVFDAPGVGGEQNQGVFVEKAKAAQSHQNSAVASSGLPISLPLMQLSRRISSWGPCSLWVMWLVKLFVLLSLRLSDTELISAALNPLGHRHLIPVAFQAPWSA